MIFDNIKNCNMYYGLHDGFEKAFDFIKRAVKEDLETGKYEIDGDKIYAFVQNYNSKLMEDSFFEGHEKYIDIQYILDGCEMLGYMDISKSVLKEKYDDKKDVTFYEKGDKATYCIANKDDFCIFYPWDIHSPGVSCNNVPSDVKKIVVKVHI